MPDLSKYTSFDAGKICRRAYEDLVAHPFKTTEEALEQALLAEHGMNVRIYWAGWESCPWIQLPNVNFCGKIPAEEVVLKMQDAKIVLSTMTWFKDGTHDRVFNGMLQGAVAMTDTSGYMKEEFCGVPDGEGSG